jgi:hypothetical protein
MDITIEHNGVTYGGEIMQIESTSLTREDHGIFTAYLHCKGGSTGVSVGGYCLDTPVKDEDGKFLHREGGKFLHREGTGYGLDHIIRIMETIGVSRWENLPGKHVVVLFEGTSAWGSTSKGIASLTGDRVLILSEHADLWMLQHADVEAGAR